jgi:hypothetical protein
MIGTLNRIAPMPKMRRGLRVAGAGRGAAGSLIGYACARSRPPPQARLKLFASRAPFSDLCATVLLISSMHDVEELGDLAPGTKNNQMRLGRRISQLVKKATTRHFETAPVAIHPMQSSDVAQGLFRHRNYCPLTVKSSAPDQINLSKRNDNRCH